MSISVSFIPQYYQIPPGELQEADRLPELWKSLFQQAKQVDRSLVSVKKKFTRVRIISTRSATTNSKPVVLLLYTSFAPIFFAETPLLCETKAIYGPLTKKMSL